jgi:hypothetical protein
MLFSDKLMNLMVLIYTLTYAKNGQEANEELRQLFSKYDYKVPLLKRCLLL